MYDRSEKPCELLLSIASRSTTLSIELIAPKLRRKRLRVGCWAQTTAQTRADADPLNYNGSGTRCYELHARSVLPGDPCSIQAVSVNRIQNPVVGKLTQAFPATHLSGLIERQKLVM